MKIITENFGEIELETKDIINFPQGVLGFEDKRNFTVLDVPDNPFFKWLQSVEDGNLAFLITNPFKFFPSYEFELSETDKDLLGTTNSQDIATFVIVTVPGNDISRVTANLLGPIVISVSTGKGKQVVLSNPNYSTKQLLFESTNSEKSEEAAVKEAEK